MLITDSEHNLFSISVFFFLFQLNKLLAVKAANESEGELL